MTVVSNTSPLRYLVAAGHADLLAKLFGTILVPSAVEREILDPHASPSVQRWMAPARRLSVCLQVYGVMIGACS
jgi:predicted nucleic acid-binding protein